MGLLGKLWGNTPKAKQSRATHIERTSIDLQIPNPVTLILDLNPDGGKVQLERILEATRNVVGKDVKDDFQYTKKDPVGQKYTVYERKGGTVGATVEISERVGVIEINLQGSHRANYRLLSKELVDKGENIPEVYQF